MLWTIVVILTALWLIGTVTAFTAGGLIHLLLLVALALVLTHAVLGHKHVT